MLSKIFPFVLWFKGYSFDTFRKDAVSGLTVALVLIPQSMAYAQLAGLPAYYGLYASFLPPMIAALFGSSRQLATGPVAVVSLMTSASLEPLATAGSPGYISYAIILALTVGVFQLGLGVFRLGVLVNFLSHPVVNGFTNAAALIIASSQLSKLFGVYVDKAHHHYQTIANVIVAALHYTHWPTFLLGALAFAIMYGLRKFLPAVPNVLVAVIVTTLISWTVGFQRDARVSLSQIHDEHIAALITDFNRCVHRISRMGKERTRITGELEQAKSAGDKIAIVETRCRLEKLQIELEHVHEKVKELRRKLRSILLIRKGQP